MAVTHVKSFSGGDVREWFQKFEICSDANVSKWLGRSEKGKEGTNLVRRRGTGGMDGANGR